MKAAASELASALRCVLLESSPVPGNGPGWLDHSGVLVCRLKDCDRLYLRVQRPHFACRSEKI